MMKKMIAILALMLIAGLTQQARADYVTLQTPDGIFHVSEFDWQVGNALSVNSVPNVAGGFSQLYYQAYLTGLKDENGNAITLPTLNSVSGGWEMTAMAATLEQIVIQAPGYVNLHTVSGETNYVSVFISTNVNHNDLAGTGFGDGDLVFSGSVNAYDIATGYGITTFTASTPSLGALDQYNSNDYPDVLTVQGTGGTNLYSPIDYINSTYASVGGSLTLSFSTSTNNTNPFRLAYPSGSFLDLDTMSYITPTFYWDSALQKYVNGYPVSGRVGAYDFQFQADAASSVVLSAVPEPSSLMLLGGGLLALAGFATKKIKK